MSFKSRFIKQNALFLAALACFIGLRATALDYMLVPSGSMNPTLLEGDFILTNRTAYGLNIPFTHIKLTQGSEVKRGDIVVFKSPENGETLVKRVVGLPGDTVEMKNDRISVNDEPFSYLTPTTPGGVATAELLKTTRSHQPQVVNEVAQAKGVLLAQTHPILLTPQLPAQRDFSPIKVPEGKYLMLGDNRDNSRDSRYIGFVPKEDLIGRVRYIFISLNPDNNLLPRLGRTLKKLA